MGNFFLALPYLLPYGQSDKEQHAYPELHKTHYAVTRTPRGRGKGVTHDKGADYRAHSPEAVQPAHMARLVMQRNVIIQRSVYRARAQSVGNGEYYEHPEFCGKGKSQKRPCGEKNAYHGYDARPHLSREKVGKKAP